MSPKKAFAEASIEVNGVVLPYEPPIDKIAALALIQLAVCHAVGVAGFHGQNECSPDKLAAWEAAGVYPIDMVKYHGRWGSATEAVANDPNLNIQQTGRVFKLIEMINHNNRTGFLKGIKRSISWLLRELYKLDDPAFPHEKIIAEAALMVEAWVRNEESFSSTRIGQLERKYKYLWQELDGCEPEKFGSPQRLLWDLDTMGLPPGEIVDHVRFWLDGEQDVTDRRTEAGSVLREMPESAKFALPNGKGAILVTDNPFVTKEAARKYEVLITVRQSTGHAAIMTNRLDASELATELQKREPGRWFYAAVQGIIINGGRMYPETPPTKTSLEQLKALVVAHPPLNRDSL